MSATAPQVAPQDRRPPLLDRVAGAPISWGVCEVPGWGWQYDPATVLTQMREVGLRATEFGPDDFLPPEPTERAALLASHGLAAVGQFVPVVLHDPSHDPLPEVDRAMDALVEARASTVVLAAATGAEGYDDRPVLDAGGWETLLHNLDRLDEAATARGLRATLHPHVGTMVESGEETDRVLDGSRVALCLDTGHLLIGGGDPVAVARRAPTRIGHVHLKDVATAVADRVRAGRLSYTDGVRKGMYQPLGAGDVDVPAIVTALERSGYAGWYVLEQDTILDADPAADASVTAPLDDIRTSIEHLRQVAASLAG
jgi:inosose dehydratase